MKKLVSFLLALVLTLSLTTNALAAVVSPTADATEITANQAVKLTVAASEDEKLTGVVCLNYRVYFDPAFFELDADASAADFEGAKLTALKTDERGSYYAVSLLDTTSAGLTVSGDLYTLAFKVKDGAKAGDTSKLTLVKAYVYTIEGGAMKPMGNGAVENGEVTVKMISAAPANVTLGAAKVVNGGIQVTWQAAANAATYNVYRMGPGDTYWKVVSAKQSGTSYTDKNVTAGNTYKYTVRGVAADGTTLSPSYDGTGVSATMTKPAVPANVTLTAAKAVNGGIQVTWQAAAGAATYNVYRMGPGDTYWKVVSAKQSGTSYTDKNVTAGNTYKYTVRGVASDGKTLSPSYDGTGVSATMTKPAVPANVTLTGAKAVSGGIQVTWQAAAGAATYNVYRMGPGDTYWKVVSAKQSGTSYTDKNVTAGGTYKYTVRGVASDGKTLSPSYDGTGKSATAAPANVTMNQAKVSGNTIVVTWQAAAGAATYTVYRMGPGDTYWKVVSAKQSGTSYTDKSVTAGSTYKYTVRGVASDGKTLSPSYDGTGKSATMPKAPDRVTVTSAVVSGDTIIVTWQKAANAATYNVYRMGPGDTYWKVVSTKQSGTSYTDKNVKLNSTYKYTVRGVAADGTTLSPSYDGTGKSATMPKTITPANVTLVSAKAVSGGIQVTWQAAAGAATYNVYRMGPGDTYWKVVSAKQSGTGYTDKNVKPNSTYKYTVRGVAADGTTLSLSYDGAGVSATMPKAPDRVIMSNAVANGNTIVVTWQAAAGAATYNVYRMGPGDTYWKVVSAKQSGTSYTDKNVTAGNTYKYTVRGVAADGTTLSPSYDGTGKSAVAK